MRIDLYTKLVLTVIAGALLMIAANPLIHPKAVEAQNGTSGYQFVGVSDGVIVIDERSNMWLYPMDFANHTGGFPRALGKISHLGEYPDKVDKAQ